MTDHNETNETNETIGNRLYNQRNQGRIRCFDRCAKRGEINFDECDGRP